MRALTTMATITAMTARMVTARTQAIFQDLVWRLICRLVPVLSPIRKPVSWLLLTKEKMKIKHGRVCSSMLFVVTALLSASQAHAQLFVDALDWKESEVPPPPAFDVKKLVTFEVPRITTMVYGVDPASVTISKVDSLVRYVMVITSETGARNVMYEALRCSTGEFKTYARYSADGKWRAVANPEWRSVFGSMPSPHPLWFAKAGACDGAAPVSSPSVLVTKLKDQGRYLDP